jgi:hypothetical protein
MKISNIDPRTDTFYPVQLSRISKTAPEELEESPFLINKQFLINPLEPKDLEPEAASTQNEPLATTFSQSDREFQKELTGSDKAWSDIVMKEVLSDTAAGRTKGLVKDVVNDWSINSLTEQGFSLLLNLETATTIVMHELIHSIAMGPGEAIGM